MKEKIYDLIQNEDGTLTGAVVRWTKKQTA